MARRFSTRYFILAALSLCAIPASASAQQELDIADYVAIVLRTHPSAGEAGALENAAVAERRAPRFLADPVVEWGRADARTNDGGDGTESSLSVSQTFPWPGTYAAGLRAGERAAEGLRAASEEVRWRLEADARAAFHQVLAARARVEIARATEADARALRDLTARRAELGEIRESDRIKAQIEWLREERALAAAQRQAQTTEALLRALAGEPLPEPLALLGRLPHAPPSVPSDDELAARLVGRSPALRAARARAAAETARLDLARSSRVPDLGLTLFRDRELDKDANGFSIGLRLPLWNAQRGEIARAGAASALAAAEAERLEVEARSALLAQLEEFTVAARQVALLDNEVLPAAARALSLVRLSFEEGETSLLDLLDAQRTQRATEREALDARLDLALSAAGIQRLVGPAFDPWR